MLVCHQEGIGDTQARINPDYPRLRIGVFAQLRLANSDHIKLLVHIWTIRAPSLSQPRRAFMHAGQCLPELRLGHHIAHVAIAIRKDGHIERFIRLANKHHCECFFWHCSKGFWPIGHCNCISTSQPHIRHGEGRAYRQQSSSLLCDRLLSGGV